MSLFAVKEDLAKADSSYNKYLSDHISNVIKAFEWIQEYAPELLEDTTLNLENEIRNHDASKYDDIEYNAYNDYFYGNHDDEIPSDVDYNFDVAWNHHQKNNPHHWQYWVLLKDNGDIVTLDMDYESILHMICDWWAFSWKNGNLKEIFTWYKENKSKQRMSPKTIEILEQTLDFIEKKLDEVK